MSIRSKVAAAGAAALVIVLGGCSSGGPAAPSDGLYAFLSSSEGRTAQDTTLSIKGDKITLTQEAGTTTALIGDPAPAAVLCPPYGQGQPLQIGAPLTIGSIALSAPAVFGNCGEVKPVRVTLIDLESYDENGGPFGFTRWVEFCDTMDPDCASPAK